MLTGLSALLVGGLLMNPGCVAAVPSAAVVTGAAASAAATYTGYKATEAKKSAAEGEQRSQDLRTYTQYCLEMEKINLEREKAGLTPRPILTQEEWLSGQAAGPVEVAPPSPSEPPTEPAADGNKIMKPETGKTATDNSP